MWTSRGGAFGMGQVLTTDGDESVGNFAAGPALALSADGPGVAACLQHAHHTHNGRRVSPSEGDPTHAWRERS